MFVLAFVARRTSSDWSRPPVSARKRQVIQFDLIQWHAAVIEDWCKSASFFIWEFFIWERKKPLDHLCMSSCFFHMRDRILHAIIRIVRDQWCTHSHIQWELSCVQGCKLKLIRITAHFVWIASHRKYIII